MQALSCGSPSVARGGMTLLELDKPESTKTATENFISIIRLSATKPNLGTPIRVPLDSNGQRLCPTPKSARPSTGMKNRATRPQYSPGAHTATTTPFQPLETIGSPISVQKQPLRVPVDSNGQRLCPTPKRTHVIPKMKSDSYSSNSPGTRTLRYQKVASFQPLETIQSPEILKDRTRRALVDSNGQWIQETPKVCEKPTSMGISEDMAPRALFNENEGALGNGAGPRMKKRARGEDDNVAAARINGNTRVTRSRTEAERISAFLRSPAVRVRVDGTREEYHGAMPELPPKQQEKSLGVTLPLPELVAKRVPTVASPAVRVRAHSPGRRGSLLRSPLVTSSRQQSEKEKKTKTAVRDGRSAKQGQLKKKLSVLLEAEK